jgi:hypothetical protein
MSQSQSEPGANAPLGNKIPPDNKPEYFLSASPVGVQASACSPVSTKQSAGGHGGIVTVVDLRATFFTLTFHNGKIASIPAGKSGLFLSRQIFFRHKNQKELLQLCTFHEN